MARPSSRWKRARRWGAVAVLVAVVAVGCSNSKDKSTASSKDSSATSSGPQTKITGVPGVTDTAISYAVIGTKANNPLGTCILDCYLTGIKAYFAFRNDQGGIYGRKLEIGKVLDDELSQNQVRALEVTSSNAYFGDFNATLLASGWGDLDKAGVPTYTWGINPEASGHDAVYPSAAVPCFECTSRGVPYAVKLAKAHKVASLGYGISENSKQAGVDFISTCLDLNGMKTLGQELNRQGMQSVTLYHPNTYNQQFVKDAGGIFDGDFVSVGFRPFESDPGNSGLKDYLAWMKKTNANLTELAMVGWINADLAYQGLKAAGPDFDRAKVVAATNQIKDYSASGLIVPIDWSRQHTSATPTDRTTHGYKQECTALVKVVSGAFQTVGPKDKPWFCWPYADTSWSEPTPTNFG